MEKIRIAFISDPASFKRHMSEMCYSSNIEYIHIDPNGDNQKFRGIQINGFHLHESAANCMHTEEVVHQGIRRTVSTKVTITL